MAYFYRGKSELEKPVAVRPTSETAMYGFFSDKIRSHRDLPLRLNQWNNVVRWEFKHPMPFIRSREFLWQEGHTAHLTKDAAGEEVLQILDYYADVYEKLLAVPVVKGKKTVKEQFPGADYTTTIEGYIPATGRGIQAATSHCLGQHFSKMFNITVEDPSVKESGEKKPPIHVWQNSWGLSTRSIGVMVLIHSDNKGLVIPPRVADIQTVIIPVGITAKTTDDERQKLYGEVDKIASTLRQSTFDSNSSDSKIRVETDMREGYSPGWKFNDWELKGVPLRLEFGPKDSAAQVVATARRDTGEKSSIPISDIATAVPNLLSQIQSDMFERASTTYAAHRVTVREWDAFIPALNAKNVCLVPHCLGSECEDDVKDQSKRTATDSAGNDVPEDSRAPSMGAKSLCIPFDQGQEKDLIPGQTKCINPKCGNMAQKWVLFGRSY